MSQYRFKTNEGRIVLYGLDKPTGGYFFSEFYRDDEIIIGSDDVKQMEESLALSELIDKIWRMFGKEVEVEALLNDWQTEPMPTPFQYSISAMFGKDLAFCLERVYQDLVHCLYGDGSTNNV